MKSATGSVSNSTTSSIRHANSSTAFKEAFATKSPYFLPDTTPVVSYAAWQLLVFAMQRDSDDEWSSIIDETLLNPLNMTFSGVLGHDIKDIFAIESLNTSIIGEPG